MNRLDEAYYTYMNVLNEVAQEMADDGKHTDCMGWFDAVLNNHGLSYDELSDADVDYVEEQIQNLWQIPVF